MILTLACLAVTGVTALTATHLYVARNAERWAQDEAVRRAARVSTRNQKEQP